VNPPDHTLSSARGTGRPAPGDVATVACIGAGVVGSGWAAVFLAQGLNVVAWDPAPDAPARLRSRLDAILPQLSSLGMAAAADVRDRLRFVDSPAAAAASAAFIQESAPDDESLKIALLASLSSAAGPDVIIASSSSKFLPSRLSARCVAPGRVIIGHPLVPTHLLPLVEVVGGDKTDAEALEWAAHFYARLGKRPLRLRRECEGYVANRLQGALLDEAIRLVDEGICTFEDIDLAVTGGFGLRMPVVGPVLHRHLAGGPGGVRHMLDHLGWRGSDANARALVSTIDARWGGTPIAALERWRDDSLVRIIRSLESPP